MSRKQRKAIVQLGLLSAATLTQSGCIAVGYRSGGGWFVWPGGLGLLLMLLLLYFFFGRNR